MESMPTVTNKFSPATLRIITGIILASSLTLLFSYGSPFVLGLFLISVSILAIKEILNLHKLEKDCHIFPVVSVLLGMSLFTVLDSKTHWVAYALAILGLIPLRLFTAIRSTSESKYQPAQKIKFYGFALFGFFYIFLPMLFIIKLLFTETFQFWFFTAVLATGLGDTFAYFGGRTFGKNKLAPKISPNKTREGAYAALLGGALGSVVLHQIYQRPEALWQQILLGMALAILGILGDLAESALKRAFGVKDSGTILPGHGGVLDRVDAYLFTLPAIYFYSQWFIK